MEAVKSRMGLVLIKPPTPRRARKWPAIALYGVALVAGGIALHVIQLASAPAPLIQAPPQTLAEQNMLFEIGVASRAVAETCQKLPRACDDASPNFVWRDCAEALITGCHPHEGDLD